MTDIHATHVLARDGGDEAVLVSFTDDMGALYGSWDEIASKACTGTCFKISWVRQPNVD